MPLVSYRFAGEISIARGKLYLSTARWILTPRIFFPPSMPRSKQLGAECQGRLSMTTALGSGSSPQARRHVRRSRFSSRRQRPSRVQRANNPYRWPKGLSHSRPIARRCMLQKQTHQIAMTALRNADPATLAPIASGGRLSHGLEFGLHFVDESINICKCIPLASGGLFRNGRRFHVRALMLSIMEIGLDSRLWGAVHTSTDCCYRRHTNWLGPSTNRFVLTFSARLLLRPLAQTSLQVLGGPPLSGE
jgi:hypothetical protein